MNKLIRFLSLLLQFFPLTVFLQVALRHGAPQAVDFVDAFLFGGAAAIVQLALSGVFFRGRPLNRMMLGVNLYLIISGMAVLARQTALLGMLSDLRESGIFLCLLAVGVFTTVASSAGFVGAAATSMPRDVRRYSLWLLGLTGVGVLLSFWFRGQWVVSAAMPLIALSVTTRLFKRRLQRDRDSQGRELDVAAGR